MQHLSQLSKYCSEKMRRIEEEQVDSDETTETEEEKGEMETQFIPQMNPAEREPHFNFMHAVPQSPPNLESPPSRQHSPRELQFPVLPRFHEVLPVIKKRTFDMHVNEPNKRTRVLEVTAIPYKVTQQRAHIPQQKAPTSLATSSKLFTYKKSVREKYNLLPIAALISDVYNKEADLPFETFYCPQSSLWISLDPPNVSKKPKTPSFYFCDTYFLFYSPAYRGKRSPCPPSKKSA